MPPEPDPNPYRSPHAEDLPQERDPRWVRSDKRHVAVHPKGTLPTRCFYCNEPTEGFKYARAWWWLSWQGFFSVRVKWFVCSLHRQQIERKHAYSRLFNACWILFWAGILLDFVPIRLLAEWISIESSVWVMFLLLVLNAGLWAGPIRRWYAGESDFEKPQFPRIVRANPKVALLSGAGKPFLDSLEGESAKVRAVSR